MDTTAPTNNRKLHIALSKLATQLEGDLHTDLLTRSLYATDGSVYRQIPLAVCYPKTVADVQKMVTFAAKHQTHLIPRAAGTSLAGQCVGTGIVMDCSHYLNQVLEINAEENYAVVQPGLIRDDLNVLLRPYQRYFGPNTATSSRAMIGGMVGNNSCGTYSLVYGTTREHLISLETVLSDGSLCTFEPIEAAVFRKKCIGNSLENQIYRQISHDLQNPAIQAEISAEFPKASVTRRNTGYAVDELLQSEVFDRSSEVPFNFCRLLCGSEGTLAFITHIKIRLSPLPPPCQVVVCSHFGSLLESAEAVLVAMQHQPRAVEMIDKIILDCTKENIEQQKNRFFVEGDPQIILAIEFGESTIELATQKAQAMVHDLQQHGYGYAHPLVYAPHISKVWALRNAGLGLLSNVPTSAKPLSFIEDMAVAVTDLPAYLAELDAMLHRLGQTNVVYYAHAGAGELHVKPTLDLKKVADVKRFREIGYESARLIKRFQGSLSGEHGDGRVRGEFIPLVVGEKNYALFQKIKRTWDPQGVFNIGKITDAPPMDTDLRYVPGQEDRPIDTLFDFSDSGELGMLHAAEKCNGSGDCRKTHLTGGTMCPSYMATKNERDTTRARANALREFLTANNAERHQNNSLTSDDIAAVLDLCLSCKACKSECPSNVDMAMLKAEFMHRHHAEKGTSFRTRLVGNINRLNRYASWLPSLHNWTMNNGIVGGTVKKMLGFAPQRSMPTLHKITLRKWYQQQIARLQAGKTFRQSLYLFCDEFTNYYDTEIGMAAIQLLTHLGYMVQLIEHPESGRAYLSKAMLDEALPIAQEQVRLFAPLISADIPLVGIEPSAILTFRDEYPKLLRGEAQIHAQTLAKHCYTIEEFLAQEAMLGNIRPEQFSTETRYVKVHGHCHQKALSNMQHTATVLSLPKNYSLEMIPSGCCGMAGSFGYEAEHYDVSMKIGELVLFPAVRAAQDNMLIAAAGTSCRHQIKDGTGRTALHPIVILWEALLR